MNNKIILKLAASQNVEFIFQSLKSEATKQNLTHRFFLTLHCQ
jgi:hypothetical protein